MRRRRYVHRAVGLFAGFAPALFLVASLACGVRVRHATPIAGLALALLALAIGAMNTHLARIRPWWHFRRHHGSRESYRHISAVPLFATALATVGGGVGFGSAVVAVLGLIAIALDTGGPAYFVVVTWRDASLWDEPSRHQG